MTISSSNRIIKRAEEERQIQQYNPPIETEQKIEKKKLQVEEQIEAEEESEEEEIAEGVEEESPSEAASSQASEQNVILEQWSMARIQEKTYGIFQAAEEESQRIIKEAKELAFREQERARKAGYERGYEEGFSEGKEKAEAELEARLQERLASMEEEVKKALESIREAKEACVHSYLEELKDCAVSVAEKVIHISLKSSGEVIKQMIVAATEKLKKTAWVKIYIDKFDYDMMMKVDADVIDELSHLSDNIKFIVMEKEERGNCIIEMPDEIVDVSVSTQMENIKDILENIRV